MVLAFVLLDIQASFVTKLVQMAALVKTVRKNVIAKMGLLARQKQVSANALTDGRDNSVIVPAVTTHLVHIAIKNVSVKTEHPVIL